MFYLLKLLKAFGKKPRPVLLCPGPVLLSRQVKRAVKNTAIGHREAAFSSLMLESVTMLKPLVGIESEESLYEIAFITGSGTAANETILSSIGAVGPTLVISNGEFGERLFDVTKLHNDAVDHLPFRWQEQIDLGKVEEALRQKRYQLVALVHHETSSGMMNPVAEVAQLAHRHGTLIFVDAISSIGAEGISVEQWGVDVLVGATGKGLSAMPGVGILVVKKSVLERHKPTSAQSHYLDLHRHFRFMRDHAQTPNTPAVQVFVSLHASLKEITKRGAECSRQVIRDRAEFTRRQLTRMKLPYADYGDGNTSSVVTCITLPSYLTFENLAREFKAEGIVVYEGKGVLKGKIFQIGHIGALRKHDTRDALRQLRKIMRRFAAAKQEPPIPAPRGSVAHARS
ncbi:MAG: aminotransferase class V-fold PLP-dependent enzyme [Actinomycetota bacterium]